MSYSRRKLLRDGAVSCLAGAVSSSVPFISSCKSNPQPEPQPKLQPAPKPTSFSFGIRIFFIGAWLFTPDTTTDANDTRIFALSMDLDPNMHHFRYGPYKQGIKGKDLKATGIGKPHKITIENTSSKATVTSLFQAASETQTFMWIQSLAIKADSDIGKIGHVNKRLRRISVPRPDQILTADFLDGSYIDDKSKLLHKPVPNQALGTAGAPSAFIFNYLDASKLTADFDTKNPVSGATDSSGDYHLRVVPHFSGPCNEQHAADMFSNLASLIGLPQSSTIVALNVDNARQVLPGDNVPWVTADELDISQVPCKKTAEESKSHQAPAHPNDLENLKTASCAGGGGGIGSAP